MSKIPKCREFLLQESIKFDSLLTSLSQTDNIKLKHNCSRVLKNLSADSTEAIEEGAVAALIQISLEVS